MKPLTERGNSTPYASGQIDVTDATRPSAAVVDMARAALERHKTRMAQLERDSRQRRRRDDGPEAA